MKLWKVLLTGLGVAAAAGVAVAIAKKKDDEAAKLADEFDLENDFDDILDEEDCCCDCDCDDCDDCVFFEDGEDEGKNVNLGTAVNSVVDGVMGGIVVAADKVSELCGKLADVVSNKLVERQEARLFEEDFDLDDECECDCDDECCCGECCECAPVEEVSEAIDEAVEATEE